MYAPWTPEAKDNHRFFLNNHKTVLVAIPDEILAASFGPANLGPSFSTPNKVPVRTGSYIQANTPPRGANLTKSFLPKPFTPKELSIIFSAFFANSPFSYNTISLPAIVVSSGPIPGLICPAESISCPAGGTPGNTGVSGVNIRFL